MIDERQPTVAEARRQLSKAIDRDRNRARRHELAEQAASAAKEAADEHESALVDARSPDLRAEYGADSLRALEDEAKVRLIPRHTFMR